MADRFVVVFHFNCFKHFSLGVHISLRGPNVEIHVPFGFLKFGWAYIMTVEEMLATRSFYLVGER